MYIEILNYIKSLVDIFKYKIRKIKKLLDIINKIDYDEKNDIIHIKLDNNIIIENNKSMMLYNKEFFHNVARYINLNPNIKNIRKEELVKMFEENPDEFNVDMIHNMFILLGVNVERNQIKEFLLSNKDMKEFIEKLDIKADEVMQNIEKVSFSNDNRNCGNCEKNNKNS